MFSRNSIYPLPNNGALSTHINDLMKKSYDEKDLEAWVD